MTRSELVRALAARFPQLASKDVDNAVKEILEAMGRSLACGGRMEIRGFGSFALTYRSPRHARNPRTGELIAVPGKYVPHFKAGKVLRQRLSTQGMPPPETNR